MNRHFFAPLLGISLLLAGCGMSPYYVDAQPRYPGLSNKSKSDIAVLVHFKSVLPGKPFDQTNCDNVRGVFWDPDESKKIGFTQNNTEITAKVLPRIALEASLPMNIGIGRVASGQSSLSPDEVRIDTRIMVPFGAYISRNVEQLLSASTRITRICYTYECVDQASRNAKSDRLVVVQFTSFRVAEVKTNTLTLGVEGTADVIDSLGRRHSVNLKQEIVDRSIMSEGYTEKGALSVMNKTANEVSGAIAEQILFALQLPKMPNPSLQGTLHEMAEQRL